jgi:integrase
VKKRVSARFPFDFKRNSMLTNTQIRNAKPKNNLYKLVDGNGLYLEVRSNGSKLWRYRYRIAGKENLYAVGDYPAMSLAEARVERENARKLVKDGIHPAHQRRTETLRRSLEAESTFRAIAEAWINENPGWSKSYQRQIQQRLSADAFPRIGNLPIRTITPAHVKDVLKRVEQRGSPVGARLLKTWIGGVFRYAAGELLVDNDPTWPLRNTIKTLQTQHFAHLNTKEIPAFLRAIEDAPAEHVTKIAAKLLWLTVVRTVELRCSEWREFDMENGLWTIPAERMKKRQIHVVPLSIQAIELLRTLHLLTGNGRYVFPGRNDRERPLTHEAIRDVFNRAGYSGKFTPHGVRSTFSTYFNESGADSEVIELSLAHAERNKTRAAYNHARKLDQRRKLLQEWADLTDAWHSGAEIIPLRA